MQEYQEQIFVTGDVVKNIAIYKGDRIIPSDPGKVSPHFSVTLGGAAQLHRVIESAVGEGSAQFAFAPLSEKEVMDFPDELAVHTLWKLQEGGLKKEHGEAGKKDKPPKTWRVAEPLGYAPAPTGKPCTVPLKRAETEPKPPPVVLVIDDADLGFRSMRTKMAGLWPTGMQREASEQPKWIIHKMSHPVAQGDLWRELIYAKDDGILQRRDNLIVITSGDELRLTGAAISRGFSWERTISELFKELKESAFFLPLLQCPRYLIVNFGCVGAILFENNSTETQKEMVGSGRLIYDPTLAEGHWKLLMQDSQCPVYGVMNTFTAAVAVHLLAIHRNEQVPFKPLPELTEYLTDGIKRGLTGIRLLRLRGHGTQDDKKPEFPFKTVARVIRPSEMNPYQEEVEKARKDTTLVAGHDYQVIDVSSSAETNPASWTLVSLSETPFSLHQPLFGLAHSYALYGDTAICHIPHARFRDLLSVDRAEMETLRSLRQMIEAYCRLEKAKRPLCIAAFGPSGAGKSFGIKQIANEVLGKDGKEAEILEFNLSQYDDPNNLVGAFHQVRDKVLQGHLPVVFWDEFDSQGYKWLQFLLSPMQDGSFQADQLTHPLGKCIFVFAGATSWDFEHFGPSPQPPIDSVDWKARQDYYKDNKEVQKQDEALEADFRLKKGPDFMSRLEGHIDVLGPNPRMLYNFTKRSWTNPDPTDITWPVRRAILLRSYLGVKGSDVLDIDRDLLRAFLMVPRYVYGARSMDKIARPLAATSKPFRRAYLPPPQVLSQHLDTAECFDEIFAGYRLFRDPKTLWLIAAAIMENYWRLDNETQKGKRRNFSKNKFVKALASEDAWGRATNLAAAARLPEVLAVAGLKIEKDRYANVLEREKIRQHILHPHHLHNMAREEHNLWIAFHRDNDWGYIDPESDHLKKLTPSDRKKEIKRLKTEDRLQTLLIPFEDLPEEEKEKDYDAIKHYQEMADLIGYKITFMTAEW